MRLSRALFVFLLVVLPLAGCADKAPEGVTPAMDDEGRYVIKLTNNLTFDPIEAIIPKGGTIVWVNEGPVDHDVAGYKGDPIKDDTTEFSSSHEPPDGLGRLMHPGEEYTHTFTSKGAWTIWCHTHHEERMKGVVHVVDVV